jgi:urease accessory protein
MSQVRPLRVGVAGPVGTGKSSLVAAACGALKERVEIGVVTNDIYTDEDARFLRATGVLSDERILAVQTGCCPHTAIRDDVSENLNAADELNAASGPLDLIFIESGGDNLTATFSPALADVQIFVLDCAGGDDVPRKGGPGIARSDLLVINKIDLAPYVGSDVTRMLSDSRAARDGRAVLAISLRQENDVEQVAGWVLEQLAAHQAGALVSQDPGPMAPHHHPGREHTEHKSHAHSH